MLKHYVEFFYPGIFMSESSTKEVTDRNTAVTEVPQGVYGYRHFSREEVTQDGELLLGKK